MTGDSYISTQVIVCPPVCPLLYTDLFVRGSEGGGWGSIRHSAALPCAGHWAPRVSRSLTRGSRGVESVQSAGCWKQQRPKYNSPEEALLLLLPRGSCQPGGAQPRWLGFPLPRPRPARPQPGPRASTALTDPPQLEPRAAGPAWRQPCNHTFLLSSVNADGGSSLIN